MTNRELTADGTRAFIAVEELALMEAVINADRWVDEEGERYVAAQRVYAACDFVDGGRATHPDIGPLAAARGDRAEALVALAGYRAYLATL